MQIETVRNSERETFGKPLQGLKVLAVEQVQALPFGTQLMAFLGAEIVKVEAPGTGESGRQAMYHLTDDDGSQVGATFLRTNLSKKSLAVDVRTPAGAELIRKLTPYFDIVAENYKPGTLDACGLGYADLARVHPSLIYVSVSGFGNLDPSPYRSWPAYAPVVQAMSGICEALRKPGEYPSSNLGAPIGDLSAALYSVIGMLAALRHRDRTGQGQYVDVAMMDAMVSIADMVPFMYSLGAPHPAQTAAGLVASFKASDGFILVCVLRMHQFKRLAELVGRPAWLSDERLRERKGWVENLETIIRPAVEAWAKDKTRAEAARLMSQKGIAIGPYLTAPDIITDEHVRMRNMLIEVPRPDGGNPLMVTGNPVKMSALADGPVHRWPKIGEHTNEILRGLLGMSEADLNALRASGVVSGGESSRVEPDAGQ